ncbi:MAG: hypothetical protein EB107_13945, partial [Proteobacteria bacterium]|nr:hypothetical protein [Pseudomonadota bacterium]
ALLAGIVLTAIFLGFFSWGVLAAASQFGRARPSPLMALASQSNIDFASIIWGQVLSAGLYGVAGIGALLAIFLGAPTIAREVETGTLQLLASRPIGRWEIVTDVHWRPRTAGMASPSVVVTLSTKTSSRVRRRGIIARRRTPPASKTSAI